MIDGNPGDGRRGQRGRGLDASSDEALAARAGAGDIEALDRLLRRNLTRIHGICRRITCHDEDAKDATQEALIAIHRSIAGFDARSSFATWMYRVATNAALMEVRRRSRRPTPQDPATDVPHAPPDPDAGARWDQRLDVDAALARLAPEFRAAVVLRDLCDLDYAAIAAVLEVPEGTVRSRIHRGRHALRALLTHAPH